MPNFKAIGYGIRVYGSFCKKKKLSQFLKSHISEMLKVILLKFDMWTRACPLQKSFHFVKVAQSFECVKSRFLSSCQYTYGVECQLLGPHDTLLCVLITARTPDLDKQSSCTKLIDVACIMGRHVIDKHK